MGRFLSSVQYWPSLPLKVDNEGAETILFGNLFHILHVRSIKKFELILDLGGFSVGGNKTRECPLGRSKNKDLSVDSRIKLHEITQFSNFHVNIKLSHLLFPNKSNSLSEK